ncbi:hypothetical protein RDABS01_005984 [Bienertia sinuspersici]
MLVEILSLIRFHSILAN